jgi:hypothetical protein
MKCVSKGGTVLVVMDSPQQTIKDPELSLILGNSWFSLELLDPELFKSQIKYNSISNLSNTKTIFNSKICRFLQVGIYRIKAKIKIKI